MLLGREMLWNEQIMVAAWYNTRLTTGHLHNHVCESTVVAKAVWFGIW